MKTIFSWSKLYLLILLCAFSYQTIGQKVFQIEKINSAKTNKFYIGEQFNIRLTANPTEWLVVEIIDLLPEDSLIIFDIGTFKIEDIVAVQPLVNQKLAKAFRLFFQNLGISVIGYSLFDPIAGRSYDWRAPYVSAGSFILAFLGQFIIKRKFYRIGKSHRIRLLDLTIWGPGSS